MEMKTMELVFLLILLPVTHSVEHSLTYYVTTSSGLQTFPAFVALLKVGGVQVGYCDTNNTTPETKQDWAKKFIEDYPQHLEMYTQVCKASLPISEALIEDLKQQFNQTGGVHILQEMYGCELDDNIKDIIGYDQFGYEGEDFMSLDLMTQTWVYTKQAAIFKNKWESVYSPVTHMSNFLTNVCPNLLRRYLEYGKSFLQRKVLPSVSLLQKTPSSPVSCHATGFYPDRAEMLWRKDGEELHEYVEHGEILPNHDGTSQMSVDLNISSVKPEDWSRYDCVFQLSGVKDDIVTKLNKTVIRTNWVIPSQEKPSNMTIHIIIITLIVLALIFIAATGFVFYKKKAPDNGLEKLNQET